MRGYICSYLEIRKSWLGDPEVLLRRYVYNCFTYFKSPISIPNFKKFFSCNVVPVTTRFKDFLSGQTKVHNVWKPLGMDGRTDDRSVGQLGNSRSITWMLTGQTTRKHYASGAWWRMYEMDLSCPILCNPPRGVSTQRTNPFWYENMFEIEFLEKLTYLFFAKKTTTDFYISECRLQAVGGMDAGKDPQRPRGPDCHISKHSHQISGHTWSEKQGSWGQHGAHLGPTGPRWDPCWPHEPCYLGSFSPFD